VSFPQIEDVFALISPRLCAPLHHRPPLDPPKHLSVFPLVHPSVSHTQTQTHTTVVRTILAIPRHPSHGVHSIVSLTHSTHHSHALAGDGRRSSSSSYSLRLTGYFYEKSMSCIFSSTLLQRNSDGFQSFVVNTTKTDQTTCVRLLNV